MHKKNKLVIIGAGGHGKVCAEIASLNGFRHIVFLDDAPEKSAVTAGKTSDFTKYIEDHCFFVALGSNQLREEFAEKIVRAGGELVSLIHPLSAVSPSAVIHPGAVVMAGAVINACAEIGKCAIVNTASSLDHDNVLSDYAHIGVGAHLAGTVHVGERAFIGAGATIINNISVCNDCVVGAGATVIRNISQPGTYVGVPAKRIK